MCRLFDVLSPKSACQGRKLGAVFGDEAVKSPRDGSNARDTLIAPQRPMFVWRDGFCEKDCIGCGVGVAVSISELHRFLSSITTQLREALSDVVGDLWKGTVLDTITAACCQRGDPATAEIAVAVEDHYRL